MPQLQFWFLLVEIFYAPSNVTLVHLFCFTTFFKFTFSKKVFFCEKDFLEFFLLLQFFFVKQKISLKKTYILKVRDQTFLRLKFDVRLLSLVMKLWFWNRCHTLNLSLFLLLSPLTSYPLRIFFCLRRFLSNHCQKNSKCLLDHFLTTHRKFLQTF